LACIQAHAYHDHEDNDHQCDKYDHGTALVPQYLHR
jgi:hypothetical protein